jgi:hypothetical protein
LPAESDIDVASAPIYLVTRRIIASKGETSRRFPERYGSCYNSILLWTSLSALDFDAEFPRPKTSLERRLRTSFLRRVR